MPNPIEALDLAPGARILVLGDVPASWRPDPTRFQVTTAASNWVAAEAETPYDAAIVAGCLEREEWDRWTLQRVHRALKPGGRLLLGARNLLALCSAADVSDLAGRVLKQASISVARVAGQRTGDPPPFVYRRYVAGRLRSMLEDLGYAIRDWQASGRGAFAPLAAVAPALAARHACSHAVVGEKRPGYFGLEDAARYPDIATHRRAYEAEHRGYLDLRDRWLAAHPEFAPGTARALDVAAHAGRNIVVMSPHPDDEVIGCGGTLLRLVAAGARVTIVQATDGSHSLALRGAPEAQRVTIRVTEAQAVGGALGAAQVVCWRDDNRAFRATEGRIAELRALLERLQPSAVFTPFVTDAHADHHTLNRILRGALANAAIDAANTAVLGYEVWSLVPANRVCDITTVAAQRDALLLRYDTAMKVDDFIHLCSQRNFYNAYAFAGAEGLAEAFYEAPASAFGALLDSAGPPRG